MRTLSLRGRAAAFVLVLCVISFLIATQEAPAERDRLYTQPDPSASGGIRGHISRPVSPILQILAIAPDEPRLVYEGMVSGSDSRGFTFTGLPMRKYDLFVIYEDSFYEGLQLTFEEDTLTAEDRTKIDYIINKSDPYFPKKYIHRMEGTTGRGNLSRCLVTMLRDTNSRAEQSWRRTFKLCMLKDVGPGWQVVRTRDLYPLFVEPGKGNPKHNFSKALSRIRVTSRIKELKEIDLTQK